MAATRGNVEATKAFIRPRIGNPYVYGGALSLNVKQGTDCSEVWQSVLEMTLGRWKQGRQSEGATTESYRPKSMGGPIPDGGVGPFGTINVSHWSKIPADAVARIAFHHGPGGGANSHMWGELDGMRIESGGSKGLVTGDRALAIENSYANAWAYLPGPIAEDGTPVPPPPAEVVMLGRRYESSGDRVRQLQEALNRNGAHLEADGDFGPLTETAVTAFQRAKGLEVDGVAGPLTLAALGLNFAPAPPPPAPPAGGGLTAEVLQRIAGNPDRMPLSRYQELLPGVLQCLRDCGCDTVKRRAMWFGQIFHESGALFYKRELASGEAYNPPSEIARQLGNTQPGDGPRFRGRGFIQLTGRGNVTGFSAWMHSRGQAPSPTWFVDHPEEMETDINAFNVVTYYWTVERPQLNSLADNSDLLGATRAINGGTNGLDDRREFYSRALAAGDDLLDPEPLDPWEELLMSNEPIQSTSHFRRDNAKNVTPLGMLQGTNAMVHEAQTIDAAYRFEAWAIQELAILADPTNQAPGASDPDGPWWVGRAKYHLGVLYAANQQAITTALGKVPV